MSKDLFSILQGLDDSKPDTRTDYVKGPFLWPGHKYNSIKNILDVLPYKRGFVEVFGGSGVVTLNRNPCPFEVFNDRNGGIAAFYRVLRDPIKRNELHDLLELYPHSREEFFETKARLNEDCDDLVKAAMFYYTVQSSFRGEQRVFGRMVRGRTDVWKDIKEKFELFEYIHYRFRTIQVENLDWRVMLQDFDDPDADVVYYLDPPYINKNCYKYKMTIEDHEEMCNRIMLMKSYVALSGYENSIYDKFHWDHVYKWEIKDAHSSSRWNSNGPKTVSKRGWATECLWIKE